MGQLLDIVPNHMGVRADNPWWMDVLEDGAASVFTQLFDIDWEPLNHELFGKVLVPVLAITTATSCDRGELSSRCEGARGELAMHYRDHRFPLAPSTTPLLPGALSACDRSQARCRLRGSRGFRKL